MKIYLIIIERNNQINSDLIQISCPDFLCTLDTL